MRTILALETSCDDTSVAILRETPGAPELCVLASQNSEKLLAKWGGVVPELAAREHVKTLAPLLEVALKEAKLGFEDISEVAVTTVPGLIGALLTGLNAAKTLALIHRWPITPVPHLWAHLEAIHLTQEISYPYVGLLVSGGHTLIVKVSAPDKVEVLGQTLDDAAGEAFDKGGKLLGLGYPAGKHIDELAQPGNPKAYSFPVSLLRDRPGKMSFSGIKTSLRVFLEKNPNAPLPDVCASYQSAIIRTLTLKLSEVIELHQLQHLPVVVGGGVAMNSELRRALPQAHFVEARFCTDNAAMIANWALRTPAARVSFPACLSLDAHSRLVEKPPVR